MSPSPTSRRATSATVGRRGRRPLAWRPSDPHGMSGPAALTAVSTPPGTACVVQAAAVAVLTAVVSERGTGAEVAVARRPETVDAARQRCHRRR
jgi:hypothetical protein